MMLVRGSKAGWACLLALLFSGALLAQNYSATARNTGYRDGLEKGRNDAREGKSYNLDRHDAYKDADRGYRDSFRNKDAYKQIYRDSFRRGYQEGYNQAAGGARGRGPDRDRDRDRDQGNRPGDRRTGDRPGGMPGSGNSVYADTARNTGYRDGLDKGRNDARQRKSYNLERHDAYKDADRGYRDSFGNKDGYKQIYRDSFRRGYDEGYGGRRR